MWNWLDKLNEVRASGRPAVLVTVVKCKGSTPQSVGARMIVMANERIIGTIGGGQLEARAIEDAKTCLIKGHPVNCEYVLCSKTGQCCGGVVELLMEPINSGPQLYTFGAGHVGRALCRTLSDTPFLIHLIDCRGQARGNLHSEHREREGGRAPSSDGAPGRMTGRAPEIDDRPEWINASAIPSGVIRHSGPWREFAGNVQWDDKRSFAVVMTHSHQLDQEIIGEIVKKPACYIGLIGSRNKWLELQLRLRQAGIDQNLLDRVRCPIGAPNGGKAPQEIAISISAELLKTYYEDNDKSSGDHPLRREIEQDGGTEGSC